MKKRIYFVVAAISLALTLFYGGRALDDYLRQHSTSPCSGIECTANPSNDAVTQPYAVGTPNIYVKSPIPSVYKAGGAAIVSVIFIILFVRERRAKH